MRLKTPKEIAEAVVQKRLIGSLSVEDTTRLAKAYIDLLRESENSIANNKQCATCSNVAKFVVEGKAYCPHCANVMREKIRTRCFVCGENTVFHHSVTTGEYYRICLVCGKRQ